LSYYIYLCCSVTFKVGIKYVSLQTMFLPFIFKYFLIFDSYKICLREKN
jgi:hypothetical protein